jgi:hypothetical protein
MRVIHTVITSFALLAAASGCDETQKPKPIPDSGQSAKLPKGALLLMEATCPAGFADATGKYNGRLIMVDNNAVDAPVLTDGDGAHSHAGGAHEHNVTGMIAEPSDGFREGNGGRRSPGLRSPIQGKALTVAHEHDGGAHRHASVGLRVCQVQ